MAQGSGEDDFVSRDQMTNAEKNWLKNSRTHSILISSILDLTRRKPLNPA